LTTQKRFQSGADKARNFLPKVPGELMRHVAIFFFLQKEGKRIR